MQRAAYGFHLLDHHIAFASRFALAVAVFHQSATLHTCACIVQYLFEHLRLEIPWIMGSQI